MNLYNVAPMVENWRDYGRIYIRAISEEEAAQFAREHYGEEASREGFFFELLEGENESPTSEN